MIHKVWLVSGMICLGILLFTLSCKEYHRNGSHAQVPLANIKKGEALAQKYCRSCHLFPEPRLLDSRSWGTGVLPNMGPRLGIFQHLWDPYPSGRHDPALGPDFYPSKPLLNPDQWQYVLDYYTATSPDSLPGQERPSEPKMGLPLFRVESPSFSTPVPSVSFLQLDPSSPFPLWLADLKTGTMFRFGANLQPVDSLKGLGTVVDLRVSGSGRLVTDIGQINPNNGRSGKLGSLRVEAGGRLVRDTVPILDSLARPVQVLAVDLDADGKKEYLACEFGFMKGSLSWYRPQADGTFRQQVLNGNPGAVRAEVQDYNQDGLPDVWTLFSQGDESISLFTNKGNGTFSERKVLRFPPAYGSTYFELVDFNKDGHTDILYTCGDNADYSMVLKPYHGIYIFLNDGKNGFTQAYFFPVNGCYKALARDFDGDNDLDIATISFFADYARQPNEGFVYLENGGKLDFTPYTFPEAASGRWLTMDAGDMDGDGRLDIVLGNFADGPPVGPHKMDWTKGPLFLLLKNTGRGNR